MAPKQNRKLTVRELASNREDPAIDALFGKVMRHAYEDQQKILKQAEKIKK